jgi:hypothetical protein
VVAGKFNSLYHVPKTCNTIHPKSHKSTGIFYCLDLGSSLQSLLLLQGAHLGLGAHDTTTPLAAGGLVLLHVAILDGGDELGELVLVLGADLGEGEDGSGLVKRSANNSCTVKSIAHTFLWTTVPRRALPLMMA